MTRTETRDSFERLEIKPVPKTRLADAVAIWVLSFGDANRDFWFDYAEHELDTVLGAFIGDELGAVVGVHDFETMLFGKWVPCAGIAAVASSPTRRGQGLVKALLAESLRIAHDRQVPISMLGASKPAVYEGMGWAVSDWQYLLEVQLDRLKNLKSLGSAERYAMIADGQFELAAAVRERWLAGGNLGIRRSDARWQRLDSVLGPDFVGQLLVHCDGYMILDLGKSKRQDKLVIAEWVYLTDEAFKDGLAVFANMQYQHTKVEWVDSTPEPLLQLGYVSSADYMRIGSGEMSRVVNLEAFEQTIDVSLKHVPMRDPLAVTCPNHKTGLTPGQLVQLATGFWSEPPRDWPKLDIRRVPRAFTAERF